MKESHEARVARYKKDHAAYCAENLKIIDKAGELVPFKLNRMQRRVDRDVQEMLDAGKPVRLYLLKARQLGSSTLFQSYAYKRTTLWGNATALIVSHEVDSAVGLHEKSKTFVQLAPEDFRPMQKLNNRRELNFDNPDQLGEPGLKSRIIIQTADNKNLGVSLTIHFLHLSEFAVYEEVNSNIKSTLAKLLPAVPKLPNTYVVIETTARGLGHAKDVWDDPKSGYHKIFVSWIADDQYRSPRKVDPSTLSNVPDSAYGDEEEAHRVILRELEYWYAELDEEARKEEALHRLAWRREMLDEFFHGDLGLFRQEFPLTAEEAFLASGTNVFDARRLHGYREALEHKDADGFVTPLFKPEVFRFDKQAEAFFPATYGELRVYEKPKPGVRYVIGSDSAEGLGEGDDSGAQVLRLPELVQVATFQGRIAPDDFADALYTLGKTYNWAWICPEVNTPGIATVLRLDGALGYPHVYQRQVLDSISGKFVDKPGWQTNRLTKPLMITELRGAIRDDLILFKDAYGPDGKFENSTLDQLMHYVQGKDGKMGAVSGRNDDLVLALALALQMSLQMGYTRLGKGKEELPPEHPDGPPCWSFDWWAKQADEAREQDAA